MTVAARPKLVEERAQSGGLVDAGGHEVGLLTAADHLDFLARATAGERLFYLLLGEPAPAVAPDRICTDTVLEAIEDPPFPCRSDCLKSSRWALCESVSKLPVMPVARSYQAPPYSATPPARR